ncbi:MAG: phosphopentomutase [Verrucomicrobia bacterium]|nr:phosphopentomutase [Verrucomicrobiota bacterium]
MTPRRAILIVMDSFGIGAGPDAHKFETGGCPDSGSDTLGHIAESFLNGSALGTARPLRLPNLQSLGLAESYRISRGKLPAGWTPRDLTGHFACAESISTGKDTPSGHWEIAGVPVRFDWNYFPKKPDCFPAEILSEISRRSGIEGSLGNRHASGTEILETLGAEHFRTGLPIFYTSADSVFQIACHEESFGLERLYALCKTARAVLDQSGLKIGRVIARPFQGPPAGPFQRTGNRHDYAVPPPAPTLLQRAADAGRDSIGVGKIADIYAHTGITEEVRASGHEALWNETLSALDRCRDGGLVMANFVDFDAVFGHRRDTAGYGLALEEFDACLPELAAKLRPGDLLCITADHGNDPTWPGTDHTRERVPVLFHSAGLAAPRNLGLRRTFADTGQTLARWLSLPAVPEGTAMF